MADITRQRPACARLRCCQPSAVPRTFARRFRLEAPGWQTCATCAAGVPAL